MASYILIMPSQIKEPECDTYNDKNGLKDGTTLVSTPVGVTEEGTKKGEDVDSACPFAHIISCISIILAHHSGQKQH